ncbi:ribosomal protein S18-alanine N-acetyltransferase [Ancylobacter oerskovii]|uniref:Ribosomal protein S18-alanine N-acetyltransferase n=1 Tax=Ancylobacter oerskovii TaxID=459519 RepID=A0ABW4YVD3_9HYPH|nr:ribosomal protein S18-alanine N-acetyltransferase [Ancylobacter oerskovii]MBS7544445.1 ribosomal protein S18-alanine N-acetyltransferase [Ancylobacter oerskovii]
MSWKITDITRAWRAPPAFRPASAADAEALAGLHAASFRIGWEAAEFERLIADRLSRALVATDGPGGRVTGFILTHGVAPEMEILSIAVARTHRGGGIGRALVEKAMARLAAEGIAALFLEVEDGNAAAQRLYEHAGFREIGRRPGYYRDAAGRPVAAIAMRRDLT